VPFGGSLDLVARRPERIAYVRDASFNTPRYALNIAVPVSLPISSHPTSDPAARVRLEAYVNSEEIGRTLDHLDLVLRETR
jgi:hypothetical protein